jgi:hypothetical protein
MMGRFDFEKLTVYQRIREINARIIPLTFQVTESDKSLKDQLAFRCPQPSRRYW